ncbi:MAG: S1/P1 nuclease [Isosphaeraceae bacterium]
MRFWIGKSLRPRPEFSTRAATRVVAALAALLAWLALGPPADDARAWGRLGHRASARLAEARLTPTALAAIRGLLEPGESLADASLWADEIRPDRPETGPWHYVNVPITAPRYEDRHCPEQGCVVGKIRDFRAILVDANASRTRRQEALRFLVHFVQDMHQPLHVGDRMDRGGNDTQVQFFGRGSNLHRVWDSGLIERAYRDDVALARDLETLASAPEAARWSLGSEREWADESLDLARRAYRPGSRGPALKRGARLEEPYLQEFLPMAKDRVARSGVRLAAILNAILDPVASDASKNP